MEALIGPAECHRKTEPDKTQGIILRTGRYRYKKQQAQKKRQGVERQ